MNRYTHRVAFMTVASLLVGAALLAQDVRYEGTIAVIEQTRMQVKGAPDANPKAIWFGVTDETPVVEGDRTTTFAAAKLRKNATVVVTVPTPPDSPPAKEWSCTMHTHVALAGPGNCPVCGMALAERDKAVQAKEIRVTKR